MGGRGGSVGGSQGTARVARAAAPAAPAPSRQYDVTVMARMSDAQLTRTIDEIFTTTRVDGDQQNSDTQRFFNAIGWADRKPQVLGENAYETARRAARGQSWYHTDDTVAGVPDASKFSKQYMGAGRQFLSGGIHGDGTYWANNSRGSWAYGGASRAAQFKGFFNSKASIVSEAALDQQIKSWSRSHPARTAKSSAAPRGTKTATAAQEAFLRPCSGTT